MKKILFFIAAFILFQSVGMAQNNEPVPSKEQDMKEGLKKMQEQMMRLFDNGTDSTDSFSFGFGDNFMKIDTAFSKSFGFMFDGENWKSLTPDKNGLSEGPGNEDMSEILKQLQQKMKHMIPDMKDGFDMSEMFKGFGNMFGNDPMILPEPNKNKKRLGEEERKEKKYKTEKL